MKAPVILLLSVALVAQAASAQAPAAAVDPNAVTPGELLVEPPTLINLGFEWLVQGDNNRNATVAVSYRKKGELAWKQGLPLLRLKGERIYSQAQIDVITPNMFAGSLLDLEPDTAYEAQFVLSDPEGVRGEARADRRGTRGPPRTVSAPAACAP